MLVIALLIGLSMFSLGGERQHRPNDDQAIAIRPILLDPQHPARTELGRLRFLGAWHLTSDNDRFGGISSLVALGDDNFIALGDAATLIGFGLTRSGLIVDPFIRPLPWRGNQEEEPGYEERDSESVVRDPVTGKYWVSLENHPSLRRYSADFMHEELVVRPEAMKSWPTNAGPEALARLADGRFLVLSEAAEARDGGYEALLYPGEPRADVDPMRFAYAPPEGFKPTDAKLLPDGRVLILHRRLAFPSGLSASIGIADPATIRAGRIWRATELARLKSPLAVDNMEGLAITQEAGSTIVWIISDDNFNAFQRTLLLKFALPDDRARKEDRRLGQERPGLEQPGFERPGFERPGFESLPD